MPVGAEGDLRAAIRDLPVSFGYHLLGTGALAPREIIFFVTLRSNLREPRGAPDPVLAKAPEMSLPHLRRAFEGIPGGIGIGFAGGEPFVREDFGGILAAAAAGHRVGVRTNLTLLDETGLIDLVRLAARPGRRHGLRSITVPIYGSGPVHDALVGVPGALKKTLDTARRLVDMRDAKELRYPLVAIRGVVTPGTTPGFAETRGLAKSTIADRFELALADHDASLLRDGGLEELRSMKAPPIAGEAKPVAREFRPLFLSAASDQDWIDFFPDHGVTTAADFATLAVSAGPPPKSRCRAPWGALLVGPGGDARVCPFVRCGRVGLTDWRWAWQSKEARRLRAAIKEAGTLAGCRTCPAYEWTGRTSGAEVHR